MTAAVLTTACSALAGGGVDLSKLPPASDKKDLTFAKDIEPIFKASCYNCHGETGRASGGLRVNSLENVLKGGTDGKVVEVGKSAQSQIVVSVARLDPQTAMPRAPRRGGGPRRGPGGPGGPGATNAPGGASTNAAAMPPNPGASTNAARGPAGPPPKNLTPEEVGLVRAWIDQGAK